MRNYSKKELKRINPTVKKVLALEHEMSLLSNKELREKSNEFKEMILKGETLEKILPEAFAVCREAAWRTVGLKAYPIQIMGGILLHQGRIAEIKTGQGKTLVVTMPAYLNALTGKGVHVVTINDYLAKRDSEWMGKVYKFLGLSVGLVGQGMSTVSRQNAYACDITYGTSAEFGFDYLRDNMAKSATYQVQRGHNYIIIDEIDSVLIDEARTPLIISGPGGEASELYVKADRFIRTLKGKYINKTDRFFDIEAYAENQEDYVVQEQNKVVNITETAVKKAEKYFGIDNLMDPQNIEIQHHINQSLRAHTVMKKDVDYVIEDGKVQIVDENTGRIMYGRRYNDGLHQAIEVKEGIDIVGENKTLASVTLQNYCKLYSKLSGMSGTVETEKEEFAATYNIDVVVVPTNKPIIREDKNDLIFRTEKAKYKAVVEEIKRANEIGQPVLVGTNSVQASKTVSDLLKKENIKHNLLNANNHKEEAKIIAQAGKIGAVTISTNMAGRGTDIMLGGNAEFSAKEILKREGFTEKEIEIADSFFETDDETVIRLREHYQEILLGERAVTEKEAEKVKEIGGLYVIGTERSAAKRIDNQLIGRSGRQGDPGKSQFFVSLEDEISRVFGSHKIEKILDATGVDDDTPIHNKMLTRAIENAQKNIESIYFAGRKATVQYDDVINEQRKVIYRQRQQVIENINIRDFVMNMIHDSVIDLFDFYWNEHRQDLENLRKELIYFNVVVSDFGDKTKDEVLSSALEMIDEFYREKCEVYGENIMNQLEKNILLKFVDKYWMDYMDDVNFLKTGIKLCASANKDPVVEFRKETSEMFVMTVGLIKKYTAMAVLNATPALHGDEKMRPVMRTTLAADFTGKK